MNNDLVSTKNLEMARQNSRIATGASIVVIMFTIFSIALSTFVSRSRNQVAVVPIGSNWEFPAIHWLGANSSYEESTKPIHVALKYIRGLYELDPQDFSSVQTPLEPVMLSNRMAELLAYTAPGTQEHFKVAFALEKSSSLYRLYNESKMLKRFLVSDMMISFPPLAYMRIEVIGRFVIFGQDGRRPLPAEEIGYKSIVLYLSSDAPIFDLTDTKRSDVLAQIEKAKDKKKTKEELEAEAISYGDEKIDAILKNAPQAINPEGWYVVRSQVRSLTDDEIKKVRQIRLDAGMKEMGL